jgi:uncharacterized OB-fold protein
MTVPETAISDERLWELFRGYGVNHDTAPHFRGRLERRLLINRCDDCGAWRHPPRPICPSCLSDRVTATEVGGGGTIFMLVFLHQGPPAEGVDYSTPYPVVTVELDEDPGLRFTSTVVGSSNSDIKIGRRVQLDWIERAGVPLPVFRLQDRVVTR